MIIINTAAKGEHTYDITLSKEATYRVSAFNLGSALDLLADYIESHGLTELYVDGFLMKLMAECSKYQTAEAYAAAYDLARCGTNGIYMEITSIKGCPNG